MICPTPDPSPGLDQSTVPMGRLTAAVIVISADAPPAVIVACPAATAVRIGGSSVERLTTFVLLEVQDGCAPESLAVAAPMTFEIKPLVTKGIYPLSDVLRAFSPISQQLLSCMIITLGKKKTIGL